MSRVVVLKGGRSLERQVSLASGGRVQDALERLGHEVHGLDAGHDLVAQLRALAPEVVFVALHGRDGEDGTVQGLLELLEIPYTGSGVSACTRCSDKAQAKHLLRAAGLPTPGFFAFSEAAFKELGAGDALPELGQRLGYPLVVKPVDQGSALGLKVAPDAGAVPAALVAAFSYADRVLLEAHVAGADLSVSVLGDEPLPVVQAIPREGEDGYSARYTIGSTSFACPADIGTEATARVQELALAVHGLLGCRDFSRVDLLLGPDGPMVIDVDVAPGMTETSLLPQAAEAAGIGFDALVERMLAPALARG